MRTSLTEEEKAANKAALKFRRTAFAARQAEYDRGRTEIASPEQAALDEARSACDSAIARRNADEATLRGEIQALTERLDACVAQHQQEIGALRQRRIAAQDAKLALETKLEHDLHGRFQGVTKIWNLSQWVPPQGYLERFAPLTQEGSQ